MTASKLDLAALRRDLNRELPVIDSTMAYVRKADLLALIEAAEEAERLREAKAELKRWADVAVDDLRAKAERYEAVVEAARTFRDERAKLSRPIDEPNHTERAWLALLNALAALDKEPLG